MSPTPKWPKSFIATYIHKHHKQQTRYEIDLTLLQEGHSPEEIEEAWQLVNPVPPRPIPIKMCFLDLLILFSSFGLAVFSIYVLSFWSFIFPRPVFYLFVAGISLTGIRTLVKWRRARRVAKLKSSVILLFTNIFLGIMLVIALLLAIITAAAGGSELASTSAEGHNYRLIYRGGCIESCFRDLVIYKCDFNNMICPEIAYLDIWYFSDFYREHEDLQLQTLSLKIDNDKILLFEGNKVVYTFKNV
jgi:hypothetical protein